MKKTFLNGHCPYRSYPPPPPPGGATGNVVLFSAVKNDIWRVLQNQILIENDDENDDDNGDNFDV